VATPLRTDAATQYPAVSDEVTRHLSAAVHVDEDFADEIVEEFLSEQRRAIPPSPGVDPVVVLAEALSARRRRVIRDAVVLLLLSGVLLFGWPVTMPWVITVGTGLAVYSVLRKQARRRRRDGIGIGSWILILLVGFLAYLVSSLLSVAVYLMWNWTDIFSGDLSGYGSYGSYGYYDYPDYSEESSHSTWAVLATVVTPLLLLALLAVLIVDRFRVNSLLRNRFPARRWPFAARAIPWPPPQPTWYADRLNLVAASSGQSNMRVHDGYRPFIGSGELVHAWSIAIQLRPLAGAVQQSLTPGAIYSAVRNEVLAMRRAGGLAPGGRLRLLHEGREAITSASMLLRNLHDPFARAVLPDPSLPPASWVEPEQIEQFEAQSPEWIRPYQCFRVEAWDKELVISTYLHVACDDETLYMEWNAFALNPIAPELRYDQMKMRREGYALWRGVLDFMALPGTLFQRARTLWRAGRDHYNAGRSSADVDSYDAPARYGARRSLREIAAANDAITYLQDVDSVRYVKLLERRSLAAVDHALRAHGLSTEEFAQQATTVVQSTVINGGEFSGVNVVGQGSNTVVGSVSNSDGPAAGKK
jgi:hypothetical protein